MKFFGNFGVLGINARNLLYIRPYNKKKAIRLADDKLKTKYFLSARGIPVPKLYAVIRSQAELFKFDFSSLPSAFVLKPNLGYGGEGIIPFVGRKQGLFEKSSGQFMSQAELWEQISDILEGRFSMSGLPDTAFFEQLVVCDERLAKFAYKGLPDIRIVVHNLIPVMAMLRLPTRESDGKANLHMGAVGVGIDIARGEATHVVYKNKIISEVPEFGSIQGIKIPYWDEILHIASKVQYTTNLGYLAADIALDRHTGPVLLEINARAGLSVQIANLAPLRRRLERISGIKVSSPEKGVRIAQDMFGHKVEKEVKKVTGKEVIGSLEQVKLHLEKETRYVWASINPLLERTLIDQALAEELKLVKKDAETVKLKLTLGNMRLQSIAFLEDLSGKSFSLVIGKKDLQGFLIDPSKGKELKSKLPEILSQEVVPLIGPNFLELDRELYSIDRQIKLLTHLKPLNLLQEKEVFMKDHSYNPEFVYPELQFDAFHLKEKLKKIERELDDSVLGKLFAEKTHELLKKIALLESIGSDLFEEKSIALYGAPTPGLLEEAQKKLDQMPKYFPSSNKFFNTDEAALEFQKVLHDYSLDHWKVKIKKHMIAACSAGKKDAFFVREGARFSESRLRMLVAHEIETHLLTAENGLQQNYGLFNRGFADYLETQEGLAIWNQEQVLAVENEKNFRSALLVFVVDFARKHSFAETFDFCRKQGMKVDLAWTTALRTKRGFENTEKPGAFTKETVYFRGYLQIKDFVAQGGDLRDLYLGKFNLRDFSLIKQIPYLKTPKVLPKFLKP